jgi:hypothetical protein
LRGGCTGSATSPGGWRRCPSRCPAIVVGGSDSFVQVELFRDALMDGFCATGTSRACRIGFCQPPGRWIVRRAQNVRLWRGLLMRCALIAEAGL